MMSKLSQHRVFDILLVLGLVAITLSNPVSGGSADEFEAWIARMQQKSDAVAETATEVHYASSGDETSIYVDINGKGNFKSISDAVDAIPDGSKGRTTIYVGPGTYKEYVVIKESKGPITLQGSGMMTTKVTYDLDAGKAGGTLKSASFSVSSDDFIAKDITFENSLPEQKPGAENKQAVAFVISGDRASFFRCGFLGYQDTLYDRYGRHYFKNCYIRGSIDYIFGDGQSFYDACYLDTQASSTGSLTAQKRQSTKEDTGYVFSECTVQGKGYVYLGRAWGPASRVVFIRTYFADIIRPEGWFNWGVPGREKTVFYGEYQCSGPGSNRQDRVPWSYELSDSQAAPFLTKERWIGNWVPEG